MNNKRSKIILITLCALILVIFVVIYFVYRDIKNKNENYHTLVRDLSFQDDKQSYLVSEQKIVDDTSSNMALVDSSVVSKDGDVGFIETLESLARENNLSIEITSLNLNNKPNLATSSMSLFNIKAKTEGSWLGNYMFLSRLESMPLKIKIDTVSFSNVSNAETSGGNENTLSGSVWNGAFEIDVLKYK